MTKKKTKNKIVDEVFFSLEDTGFKAQGLKEALSDKEPLELKYWVISHDHLLGLNHSVDDALNKGFKLAGGVSSYFDNALGRRVFMQAVVKNEKNS